MVLPPGAASAAPGPGTPADSAPAELAPQPVVRRPAPATPRVRPLDAFGRVAVRVDAWWPAIDRIAQLLEISQALIMAVVHEESGGDPDAFPEHPERDGASFGLMQLLLPTARAVGFGGKARELFTADRNIDIGARYLASLVKQYGNPEIALVAYNGGPGAAWRAQHHLPAGPAGAYAKTVLALYARYVEWNRELHPPTGS